MDRADTTSSGTVRTRIAYLDLLRVLAVSAVLLQHVATQNWASTDIHSAEWGVFNLFSGALRWHICVLTMISGALFLSSDRPIRTIWTKNIRHILTVFLFWSLIYALRGCVRGEGFHLSRVLAGHFHMWYLYMIIGLYMIVPLLRRITASETLTRYFLLLGFMFTFLLPHAVELTGLFSETLAPRLEGVLDDLEVFFVRGYVFYFVLGYALNRKPPSRKRLCAASIIGLLGFLSTLFLSLWMTARTGVANDHFFGAANLNVLAQSIFVFELVHFLCEQGSFREKLHPLLARLSGCSLGAYLVHILILDAMDRLFRINTLMLPALPAIAVVFLLEWSLSFAVSAILRRIPILRNHIV